MLRLGVQGDEVPERVVGRLRLGDLAVRVGLGRVDHVGELDAVLDEEHGDVVADEVEGALVGVELHGEPPGVAHGVRGSPGPEHGGEPDEHGGLDLGGEEAGAAHRAGRPVADEEPVGPRAARVDHPLGDALVVEVGDLLAQVVVLQQGRAARPGLERVVGVGETGPGRGREVGPGLGPGSVGGTRRLAGGGHRLGGALVRVRGRGLDGLDRLGQRGDGGRGRQVGHGGLRGSRRRPRG